MINTEELRKQFPILDQSIGKYPLVYFDNGATTQKPLAVIDGMSQYYLTINSNIHRGVHTLSQRATSAYEEVRKKVAAFTGALEEEVIFTYGTTDGINLIASILSEQCKPGDRLLITEQDHHSNLVPWHMLAQKKGLETVCVPLLDDGSLDLAFFQRELEKGVAIAAFNHVSNSLGTVNPIAEMVQLCRKHGTINVVDGAQGIAHYPLDFKQLGADFYVFSGHKMYGPTGTGVVLGAKSLLETLPPYRGGGEMILEVRNDGFTVNELPHKYEAGTPAIAEVIGLGLAVDFLSELGIKDIAQHEADLLAYATEQLLALGEFEIVGTAAHKASILSFNHCQHHAYDIGAILDKLGIAVRTGHHCCQPVMQRFQIAGTLRASFAVYNTKAEIDRFISALQTATQMLG